MRIAVGDSTTMPEFPSHATITVETTDPNTLQKHVKKFQCEYKSCDRSYTTVGNLRTHMKTHKGRTVLSRTFVTTVSNTNWFNRPTWLNCTYI